MSALLVPQVRICSISDYTELVNIFPKPYGTKQINSAFQLVKISEGNYTHLIEFCCLNSINCSAYTHPRNFSKVSGIKSRNLDWSIHISILANGKY